MTGLGKCKREDLASLYVLVWACVEKQNVSYMTATEFQSKHMGEFTVLFLSPVMS